MTEPQWLGQPTGPGDWWGARPRGAMSYLIRVWNCRGVLHHFDQRGNVRPCDESCFRWLPAGDVRPEPPGEKSEPEKQRKEFWPNAMRKFAKPQHTYTLPSGQIVSGSKEAIEQLKKILGIFVPCATIHGAKS